MTALRIGARTSPLARTQADWVAARLEALGVDCEFVGVTTAGDVDQRELTQIGGTGVFVGAVRSGLVRGTIDVAVHSLKDLPTADEDGLRVAAVPVREDVRDVVVGAGLAELSERARSGRPVRVGTGSPRRASQLRQWAADHDVPLEVVPVRGNVDTRIGHVSGGDLDATLLAAAGLRRLGRLVHEQPDGACRVVAGEGSVPAELVGTDVLLPAAGQGALAVEVAVDGAHDRLDVVDRLDDPETRARVVAERTFLATLEAGCLAPVGVLASLSAPGAGDSATSQPQDLTLDAVIGRTIGSDVDERSGPELLRVRGAGPAPEARRIGTELAEQALARLGGDLHR